MAEEYLEQESEEKDSSGIVEDRKIVALVRSFMRKSKEYREPHLELALRSRRLYQNWDLDSISKIKRANLKPSYGFMIVETLLPQLTEIFFGDNQIVKFEGRDQEDAQYEKCLSDFIDIQFEDMSLETKTICAFKNMLLDGTLIQKVPYRFQEQAMMRRNTVTDPNTGESFSQRELVVETVYDGPDLEVVPFVDFFPDWRVKEPGNIQKMRGCAHRMNRNLSDLKKLKKRTREDGTTVGVYENLDQLEDSLSTKGHDAWSAPYWSDDRKQAMDHSNDNKPGEKDKDSIELWEYWGLYDLEGNGELVECILTIANGDVVIRKQKNFYDYQFKPFLATPNYVRPNEFYGIPELIIVESEIREARTIRNARLDQINLGVNTMWLVDRAAGIDAKNLYSRPGGIIFSNDINGVKPISVGNPSDSSAAELGYIENNISQATAIGAPPVVGATKSFARSATGVNFVQQFANSRLGLKAKIIADLYFKELVHIMLMTDRQFVTDAQWVRASSPNDPNPFSRLPTDAFFKNYDFIIDTKYDKSDELQMQKLQAAAQILQVAEQTQPGTTKWDVLLEAMLRPLVGPAVHRFARTPEEMQQFQMQNAAMRVQEQAANAQIGAGTPQPNAAGIPSNGGGYSGV